MINKIINSGFHQTKALDADQTPPLHQQFNVDPT